MKKGEIEEDDNIKILISVMKNIEKSIAGEGETTLLTQIQN